MQERRVEARGVGVGEANAAREPLPFDPAACRVEHLPREVDAEQRRGGITMGNGNQVARRAAAHFQNAPARRWRQPFDQPVPPQQVVLAAEVVDVTLATIDPVHQAGMGERRGHGFRT